eukprot:12912769-Prorocentrum_lima.AAC.1
MQQGDRANPGDSRSFSLLLPRFPFLQLQAPPLLAFPSCSFTSGMGGEHQQNRRCGRVGSRSSQLCG